ncbi:MAG: helix-turn-helix domain-containing protein [Gammaproteobacteria bacterium]
MSRSAPRSTTARRKPRSGAEPARGALRRRATRAQLLDAAFHLMAERGADGVTIKEITDTADVGFGSFYNHFESKQAIHAAVIEREYAAHADALDRLVADVDDVAEVVAIAVRHTLERAGREPVWGRFLVREGFSSASLSDGLGARFLRDVQRGLACRRFTCDDPLAAFLLGAGGVLAAAAVALLAEAPPPALTALDAHGATLPERTAAALLRVLGLPASEAAEIARRPLPRVADEEPAL